MHRIHLCDGCINLKISIWINDPLNASLLQWRIVKYEAFLSLCMLLKLILHLMSLQKWWQRQLHLAWSFLRNCKTTDTKLYFFRLAIAPLMRYTMEFLLSIHVTLKHQNLLDWIVANKYPIDDRITYVLNSCGEYKGY